LAAAQTITRIVSTGIVVITIDRSADALSSFTVVTNGASIAVDALPFIQGSIDTAALPCARIFGARIDIIAGRFVYGTVAVVIKAVANLGFGWGSIAVGEARLRADPLSLAGAKFVGDFATGPKGQSHRRRRTWANPCSRRTLSGLNVIDS